jgi:two-component system cell cycle response regulator DivK
LERSGAGRGNVHDHYDYERTAKSDQVMNETVKTVLVVEDNDQSRMLFHALLEASGYNVLEAKVGMEGWRIAREQSPDIILMDVMLPDISGLEVTRWLKKDKDLKSIPVIAITILATESNKREFLAEGCDDCVPKPISVQNFLKTVERFAA